MGASEIFIKIAEPTVLVSLGVALTKLYERWSKNRYTQTSDLADFRRELLEREKYLTKLLHDERAEHEKKIDLLQAEIKEIQEENESLRKTQLSLYQEIGELKLTMKLYRSEQTHENPPFRS